MSARALTQLLECTLSGDQRAELSAISQAVRRDAPNIHAMAQETMKNIIKELTGQDADPNRLYLNTFGSAHSSQRSFTGWEHTGKPGSSITLTNLILRNFSADKQDLLSLDLNVFEGVYTEGPGENYYGAANEFKVSVGDLRDAIWKADFQSKVFARIRDFWDKHQKNVLTLAKVQFATSAINAARQSRLSRSGLAMVMQGAGAGSDLLLAAIGAGAGTDGSHKVHTLTFDINGYPASDILRFVGPNEHTVLYIPGKTPSFHEFRSNKALERWVREIASSPEKREKLEHHFSLYNRQDGFWYTGVDNGLKKLGANQWHSGINTSSRPYSEHPFADIVKNMQERSLSDADTLIKSDSEVTRDKWIGVLRTLNTAFWPILMLVPEIEFATLAVTMGSEFGLEIDKAVAGDTYDERKEGTYGAISTGGLMLTGAALGAAGKYLREADIAAKSAPPELSAPTPQPVTEVQPLKIGDISDHRVDPSLISGHRPNGSGIYQAGDRYYIRLDRDAASPGIYEIRSDFKIRDGYVNVINPQTRKSVAIVHSDGAGGWKKVSALGAGRDRPPYRADRAVEVREELNRRGYVVTTTPKEEAVFDTIEQMKERVDALRFKLEDLGREPEDEYWVGDYNIVYRVDNVRPKDLLAAGRFRPSKDFYAVANLIDRPATIGSASLAANNNVMGIWQIDAENRTMYQYAIVLDGKKAGSYVDSGGFDHEFLDEVHFPPPSAKDVFLLDSSDEWVRNLIAEIDNSRKVNTTYGIPLDVFEDYRTGRISLDGSEPPDLPRGSSQSKASGMSPDSLESFDPARRGRNRTRDWVDALPSPSPASNKLEPQPGPSRAIARTPSAPHSTGDAQAPSLPGYVDTARERTQKWVNSMTSSRDEENALPDQNLPNHEKTLKWINKNMLDSEMNRLNLNARPAPSQEGHQSWIQEYEWSNSII